MAVEAAGGLEHTDDEIASMLTSFPDEKDVLLSLRQRLKEFHTKPFEEGKNKKSGVLTIKFVTKNRVHYTTVFEVEQENDDKNKIIITTISHRLYNECISITITEANVESIPRIDSFIQKNTQERKCFEPVLVSEAGPEGNDKKVTTTDVLQVLKLKLSSIYPSITNPGKTIRVFDEAYIDDIFMTPVRLLRGKPPFYAKYGFENYYVNNFIIPKLKSLKGEDLKGKKIYTILKRTLQSVVEDFDDDDYLYSIMLKLSYKLDAKTGISDTLITSIFGSIPQVYNFNPESAEWKSSQNKIKLLSFEFKEFPQKLMLYTKNIFEGGKRKTRTKTKTNRKNKTKAKAKN